MPRGPPTAGSSRTQQKEFFRPSCDHEALWDFERWSAESSCGTEPIQHGGGRLDFHTAWTGPESKIKTELKALIDSFLMTQDTSTVRARVLPKRRARCRPSVRCWPCASCSTRVEDRGLRGAVEMAPAGWPLPARV